MKDAFRFGVDTGALLLFGAMVLAAHAPRLAVARDDGTAYRPDPIG